MKLQKLCYYAHAWHLVWDERPLFGEPIEAWANGPVSPTLYAAHRGAFRVSSLPDWTRADPSSLTQPERATVDAVLDFYAPMSAHQLSELTHSESPWAEARVGLPAGTRSNRPITDGAMAAYYDSLTLAATEA